MKIIKELLLRGTTIQRLEAIGHAIASCLPEIEEQARGHIFCEASDIEGLIITIPNKVGETKTQFQYSSKEGLEFIIERRESWSKIDYKTWKDYYIKKNGLITKRFTPTILLDKSRSFREIGLEIGFYLVHKKLIDYLELLKLFSTYIEEHYKVGKKRWFTSDPDEEYKDNNDRLDYTPKRFTYNDVADSNEFIEYLPKIIDKWIISRHTLGFSYHVGIYLQNILREYKLKNFSQGMLWRKDNEKVLKYLYYLNYTGKLRLEKEHKNTGRFKFNERLLEKARKNIATREEKRQLTSSYAQIRHVHYKSAQRWVQRQLKSRVNLKKIWAKLNYYK